MSGKKEIVDLIKKMIEQQKSSDIETRKLYSQQINSLSYSQQELKKVAIESNILKAQENILAIHSNQKLSCEEKLAYLKAYKLYLSKYETESTLAKSIVEILKEDIAQLKEELEEE